MTVLDLTATTLYLVPALVWTIIARHLTRLPVARHEGGRSFRVLSLTATVLALNFFLMAAWWVVPGFTHEPEAMVRQPDNLLRRELLWLLSLALLRHLLHVSPVPERPPSRTWLVVNYGIALVCGAAAIVLRLDPGATADERALGHHVYEVGFLLLSALAVREFWAIAKPGGWGPDASGEPRRADFVMVVGGATVAFLSTPVFWVLGLRELAAVVFEAVLGLAIAAPFALRTLGVVVPEFVGTAALIGATAAVVVGERRLSPLLPPQHQPLLLFATVLLLGLILMPGEQWLRAALNRLILRRTLRQQAALQEFLHTLSPELGVTECCRRALAELVRVRQISGAAVILRDGDTIVAGEFDVRPLTRVWPVGDAADALPAGKFGTAEVRRLPLALREALIASDVGLGCSPILSPQRRWGHLFMRTGLLGGTFREDDAEAFGAFASHLARILDAADLLARAVAVERALAHREKLDAIGELAARVAHEIRNPVTAARSLAQQLAREAGGAGDEPAQLILGELERVERQVQELLRFARRDDFEFAPVDLAALARVTVERLRSRFDGCGVRLDLDLSDGTVARGDGEKLRQVLVNLLENALDAVDGNGGGRVMIAVGRSDGQARLRVADTGPGVPPDALPHLFEPFWSRKPGGTGLGLAIVKRTIDAHGGRVSAAPVPDGGLAFEITLPLEVRS